MQNRYLLVSKEVFLESSIKCEPTCEGCPFYYLNHYSYPVLTLGVLTY